MTAPPATAEPTPTFAMAASVASFMSNLAPPLPNTPNPYVPIRLGTCSAKNEDSSAGSVAVVLSAAPAS